LASDHGCSKQTVNRDCRHTAGVLNCDQRVRLSELVVNNRQLVAFTTQGAPWKILGVQIVDFEPYNRDLGALATLLGSMNPHPLSRPMVYNTCGMTPKSNKRRAASFHSGTIFSLPCQFQRCHIMQSLNI